MFLNYLNWLIFSFIQHILDHVTMRTWDPINFDRFGPSRTTSRQFHFNHRFLNVTLNVERLKSDLERSTIFGETKCSMMNGATYKCWNIQDKTLHEWLTNSLRQNLNNIHFSVWIWINTNSEHHYMIIVRNKINHFIVRWIWQE